MNTKIPILALFCFFLGFSISAQKMTKKKLSKREVVIVGRISVVGDIPYDSIAKRFGISAEDKEKGDVYTIPMTLKQAYRNGRDRQVNFLPEKEVPKIPNGDFFFNVYDGWKDDVSFATYDMNYTLSQFHLFGSERVFVAIPFPYKINLTKGEKAFYLGSFIVHVAGKDMHIERIEIVDEFDLAQEELNRTFSGDYQLCRLPLQEVKFNNDN